MAAYGLIGEQLGHSFSPEIHALLAGYAYRLFELKPEAVAPFLAAREFSGLNVTIPYKCAVVPLCDVLSPEAARIGSVNTIVNRDGVLTGYNTDHYGFFRMAEEAGISLSGAKVLVLGSGGASMTAVAAAREMGARAVLTVSRRGTGNDRTIDYGTAYRDHADAEILVNATPVGMYPNLDVLPIDLGRFPNCRGVLDMIFNPLRTALLLEAERLGIAHAGGLTMLVAQARRACELFTGGVIDPAREAEVVSVMTRNCENLVLIGMPGCGKTTVGHLVADRLGCPFADMDEAILENTGRTPGEIIASAGEEAFRQIEAETANRFCGAFGHVVATGGGTVLRTDAMAALRANGRVIFLERPLESLDTQNRPLSGNGAALTALYEKRLPLYRRYADAVVWNGGKLEQTVQAVCDIIRNGA